MKISANQKINSLKSTWYLWLFPVFALALSLWLFRDYWQTQGSVIRISFEDAASIQVDKTSVRFRGVAIGTVKKLEVGDDASNIIATIVLQKGAENFAVEGSKFWLVLPKVNFQGVSGLETLFQGPYISVQPGKTSADFKDDFKGQIGQDSNESIEDTVVYHLETDFAGSVTVGDSVSFRGVKIGSVTKVNISKSSQTVLVQINIQNRFTKLIRTNTVFWRKVGIQAHLGLFNSEIKVNSLDSLLHGGIDLFTPTAPGDIAKYQSKFTLFEAPPKGWEKWNPKLEFSNQ